jgi:hypothetical protein
MFLMFIHKNCQSMKIHATNCSRTHGNDGLIDLLLCVGAAACLNKEGN